MRRFVRTSAAAWLFGTFLLVIADRAAAEPIRLNQGHIVLESEGPLDFVFGSSQFGVQQEPFPIEWASIGLHLGCASTGGGCAPGQLFDFSNDTSGTVSFGHGHAIVNDTLHRDVQFTGDWHFTSSGARIPTSGREFVHVSAPFRFTGTLAGRRSDGTQIFNVDLTGFGFASLNLARVGKVYVPDEAAGLIYQFRGTDPVPEPASLLLLATGGAGVLARRRLNNAAPSR